MHWHCITLVASQGSKSHFEKDIHAKYDIDEPIAPQDGQGDMSSDNSNIAAGNSLISSDLQFGAILFDEKYGKNMEKFTSAGLSSNILFRGVNCHNKEEEKKKRKYIYIGAMQVNVDD